MKKSKLVIILLIGVFLLSSYGGLHDFINSQPQVEGLKTILTPPSSPAPTAMHPENMTPAEVIRVVDGDTIRVLINGKEETIRIIGLNTPETVDPRRPVQCFGKAASDRAKSLLSQQQILLESDPTQSNRDRYDRLLRYVWFDSGRKDYGLTTIQEGYGFEYTYDSEYKYQKQYQQAQATAEQQGRGLWADGACPTN